MYDTSFDAKQAKLSHRDRRALWLLRVAAIMAVIFSATANGQMPGAPLLQNVWANAGAVGAVNLGGGGGQSVYAAAGSWTPANGRFQASAGVGFGSRSGGGSGATYGARVAIPISGGASSSFGFAAFAGIGGGGGRGNTTTTITTNPSPTSQVVTVYDTTASSLQIPIGVAVGWRTAIGTSHGISVYATPYYEFFNSASWSISITPPPVVCSNCSGTKSGGVVRLGFGADFGITKVIGATVGFDFGGTRARGFGGPSGSLYGIGISYALGKR